MLLQTNFEKLIFRWLGILVYLGLVSSASVEHLVGDENSRLTPYNSFGNQEHVNTVNSFQKGGNFLTDKFTKWASALERDKMRVPSTSNPKEDISELLEPILESIIGQIDNEFRRIDRSKDQTKYSWFSGQKFHKDVFRLMEILEKNRMKLLHRGSNGVSLVFPKKDNKWYFFKNPQQSEPVRTKNRIILAKSIRNRSNKESISHVIDEKFGFENSITNNKSNFIPATVSKALNQGNVEDPVNEEGKRRVLTLQFKVNVPQEHNKTVENSTSLHNSYFHQDSKDVVSTTHPSIFKSKLHCKYVNGFSTCTTNGTLPKPINPIRFLVNISRKKRELRRDMSPAYNKMKHSKFYVSKIIRKKHIERMDHSENEGLDSEGSSETTVSNLMSTAKDSPESVVTVPEDGLSHFSVHDASVPDYDETNESQDEVQEEEEQEDSGSRGSNTAFEYTGIRKNLTDITDDSRMVAFVGSLEEFNPEEVSPGPLHKEIHREEHGMLSMPGQDALDLQPIDNSINQIPTSGTTEANFFPWMNSTRVKDDEDITKNEIMGGNRITSTTERLIGEFEKLLQGIEEQFRQNISFTEQPLEAGNLSKGSVIPRKITLIRRKGRKERVLEKPKFPRSSTGKKKLQKVFKQSMKTSKQQKDKNTTKDSKKRKYVDRYKRNLRIPIVQKLKQKFSLYSKKQRSKLKDQRIPASKKYGNHL